MRWCYLMGLLLLFSQAQGAESVSTGFFNKIAIGGHDTTAYHHLEQGQEDAVLGAKSFVVEWKGAKWRFATEADSKKFAANPDRYTPAYNGHCANALSLGEGLIKTNGRHWAIFNERLYLFYAARGTQRWLNGDYRVFKAVADKAWDNILQEKSKP